MKLTIDVASTIYEALNSILKNDITLWQTYEIKKAIAPLKEVLSPFHSVRDDAIRKYGETGPTGTKIKTNKQYVNVLKEIEPILKDEVEVEIRELMYEDFKDVSFPGVAGNVLLEYVFKIEGENTKEE